MHGFYRGNPRAPAIVPGMVEYTVNGKTATNRAATAGSIKHDQSREENHRYHCAPAHSTLEKGTKVVWTSGSGAEHNVTLNCRAQVNKGIKPGTSVSVTLMTMADATRSTANTTGAWQALSQSGGRETAMAVGMTPLW